MNHGRVHGRHAGEHRDFLRLELLHHGFEIEARVQHDLGAQPDSHQHVDGERVNVE